DAVALHLVTAHAVYLVGIVAIGDVLIAEYAFEVVVEFVLEAIVETIVDIASAELIRAAESFHRNTRTTAGDAFDDVTHRRPDREGIGERAIGATLLIDEDALACGDGCVACTEDGVGI